MVSKSAWLKTYYIVQCLTAEVECNGSGTPALLPAGLAGHPWLWSGDYLAPSPFLWQLSFRRLKFRRYLVTECFTMKPVVISSNSVNLHSVSASIFSGHLCFQTCPNMSMIPLFTSLVSSHSLDFWNLEKTAWPLLYMFFSRTSAAVGPIWSSYLHWMYRAYPEPASTWSFFSQNTQKPSFWPFVALFQSVFPIGYLLPARQQLLIPFSVSDH